MEKERIVSVLNERFTRGSRRVEVITPSNLVKIQEGPRLDLIIRHLAIEEMLGKNKIGLALWEKLGRFKGTTLEKRKIRLQHLIRGFKKHKGYDIAYPIEEVDKDYQLWGGSHRIVMSLRYNVKYIPIVRDTKYCIPQKKRDRIGYADWNLPKFGYTIEEIEYLKELYDTNILRIDLHNKTNEL
jgi:hypothetical protein